jgi:orotate phosphoribosyltransferase
MIAENFANFLIKTGAVRFGNFRLKSGRESNTFFDFGQIFKGSELIELGRFYASYIKETHLTGIDAIFGPAYKGINIALSASMGLFQEYRLDIPVVYNRKVLKTHGEKGNFVGCPLENVSNLLVVDDVFTDGGTKYESIELLSRYPHLTISAMIVGVDREETDDKGMRFLDTFKAKTGIPVNCITTRSVVERAKT